MKKSRPQFLVLSGDGINCERETLQAIEWAGGRGRIVHINDLLEKKSLLENHQALCLPGGFSFGDELGSGQILSLKIQSFLSEEIGRFVSQGNLIIGICNGFQVLVKLGLLPFPEVLQNPEKRVLGLAPNSQGKFLNRWVSLEVAPHSPCVWTQKLIKEENQVGNEEGYKKLDLPIRHGEGRVVLNQENEESILAELERSGQIPLKYAEDVNGSMGRIAGLCDPSGRLFGLMPHPEAFSFRLHHPHWQGDPEEKWLKGDGIKIFESAIEFLTK